MKRAALIALLTGAVILGSCARLDLRGDAVTTDANNTVFLLAPDTSLAIVASQIQSQYPNIKAANDARSPKFVDSHPAGLNHAELAGFGITMIAHDGTEPALNFDTIRDATGDLNFPNILFFKKAKGDGKSNWTIIGMAYAMPYQPGDQPTLRYAGAPVSDFVYRFLVHEAGYHVIANGNFRCAKETNLKNAAIEDGKSIAPAGVHQIDRGDLKAQADSKRHGRFWTLHVWFDPLTGRPAISPTDPWERQGDKAKQVPDCAFYFVN